MAESNRTFSIVFVSGSWHTETHIVPVIPHLYELGYRVVPRPLHSAGARQPAATFADDVRLILEALRAENAADNHVCLLGHSTSASQVVEAANQFLAESPAAHTSLLVHIVLVAAFLDRPRQIKAVVPEGWYEIREECGRRYSVCNDPAYRFYSDMSAEAAKPFIEALVPQASIVYPTEIAETWKGVPNRTYMVCLGDKGIPVWIQRAEAEEQGMTIVELETGHVPFVSQPEEFARILDSVLRQTKQ